MHILDILTFFTQLYKSMFLTSTVYPEIGGGKSVAGGGGGGSGCVSEVGVDVREQIAHYSRHVGTHILRSQTRKMSATDTANDCNQPCSGC